MEIKTVEREAIRDFEQQLDIKNVKYLTLCTEEDIVAYLVGVGAENDNEIEVYFEFQNDFNATVAKQLYDEFMKQDIKEEIVFSPSSEAEEKFITSL